MMMNVINDDDNGYVRSVTCPKHSDKDDVGMTNMFVWNLLHYGDNDDDVNVEDDKNDDGDDDHDDEDDEDEDYDHGDDDECHKKML